MSEYVNDIVKQAIAAYKEVTQDPEYQELERMREKRINDEANALSVAEKRGISIGEKRGISIGEKRGISIGEQRGEDKVFAAMEQSGLTAEQIDKIKNLL